MEVDVSLYNAKFYEGVDKTAYDSASVVLPLILEVLPKINAAVDFGCGIATWLSVLQRGLGVTEIQGFDGQWVNKDSLKIPQECFQFAELDKGVSLDKKYDLAISLEVAEHLPQRSADGLVTTLTKAADIILFSAAIPFQGGTNHVNEQWPEYWCNKFREKGFVPIDYIRKKIWDNPTVSLWYRQNTFLFVREGRLKEIKIPPECFYHNRPVLSLVTPELYLDKIGSEGYTISLLRLYKIAIKRTLKKILGERICKYLRRVRATVSGKKMKKW